MLQFAKQRIGAREQLIAFHQIVPKLVLPIPAAHRNSYRLDQSFRPQWPLKQGRASHKWQIRNALPPSRHSGAGAVLRRQNDQRNVGPRWLLSKECRQELQSHPNQCLFGDDTSASSVMIMVPTPARAAFKSSSAVA